MNETPQIPHDVMEKAREISAQIAVLFSGDLKAGSMTDLLARELLAERINTAKSVNETLSSLVLAVFKGVKEELE